MKNKVGKIILVIGICLFMVGLGYVVTKYLDKNLYLNTNLLVTFEDTKEFTLESFDVLTKKEALDTYPNKFTIENKSLKGVNYDVVLTSDTNISEDNLSYVLYKNEEEVQTGNLSDIKDVLYTSSIKTLKTDSYRLYIYLTEKTSNPEFTYKLEIKAKD
ncbi:MAG: hypothetical protein IJ068_00580 [Bacilli bacterium]|nr:hypothetical protein [Bacilli bacterium]